MRHQQISKITAISFGLNAVLAILKISVGLIFAALSLLSDGINNLFDLITGIVALLSNKLSNKPADDNHPYGHGRMEYVGSLTVGILIIITALRLGESSIIKLSATGHNTLEPSILYILAFSIIVKGAMALYSHHHNQTLHSPILSALILDSMSDLLGSLLLLVGFIINLYIKFPIDGLGGLTISLIMLISAIKLIRQNTSNLIGKNVNVPLYTKIATIVSQHPEVLGFHDLFAHEYGPNLIQGSVDITLSDQLTLSQAHRIIDEIEHQVRQLYKVELTVHVDPVCSDQMVVNEIKQQLAELNENYITPRQLDTLQVVKGASHLTLFLSCPRNQTFVQIIQTHYPHYKVRFLEKKEEHHENH